MQINDQPFQNILIVDDAPDCRLLIEIYLREAGYTGIMQASSVTGCYQLLDLVESEGSTVDLIIMDIIMPQTDGIAALKVLKAHPVYQDIPVLMVTTETNLGQLDLAFACGAADYMTKPLKKIELLARVRSALRLKQKTDCLKEREKKLLAVTEQLAQSNGRLRHLAELDGLTGIANRRRFDEVMEECCSIYSEVGPLSLIMLDIDYFKSYNDNYGHQQGDSTLRQIAQIIDSLTTGEQLAARYGGEEFAVILPGCDSSTAVQLAQSMCHAVAHAGLPHEKSAVAPFVTVSAGVASVRPQVVLSPAELIVFADQQLYLSKQNGRNQVSFMELSENTNDE